jgi:histidyl-tRNA synthetase
MRDIEPNEFELYEKVRNVFFEVCRLYDFKVMEPSPIESIEVLEAKTGPSIRDEIYFFKDKAGREVGLRFDLTVGLTRYVCSRRDLAMPFKVACFSDMWRYDEPQRGRYRWFFQWDAEIFGPKDEEADAEIIELTEVVMSKLGLKDVRIEVGDRRIVESFIKENLGIKDDKTVIEMMRELDKLDKKGVDEVREECKQKGIELSKFDELLVLTEIKGEENKVLDELSKLNINVDELSRLFLSLKDRGVKAIVNLGIVRGLDYYTGIVFEAFDPLNPQLKAIAGGGRYDVLPEIFGRPDIGATGVAGGVDRIVLALKSRIKEKVSKEIVSIAFIADLEREAVKLASKLRRKGIPCTILPKRGLRKQLELAEQKGSKITLIIAPKEFFNGKIIARFMEERREEKISLDKVEEFLKVTD